MYTCRERESIETERERYVNDNTTNNNHNNIQDVISANSHDVFCCSAAVEMHSTGKRQEPDRMAIYI